MNKSYQSIWCEETQTYVAASETAKTCGKRTKVGNKFAASAFALSAIFMVVDEVKAGSLDGGTASGSNGSIAIGETATASGTGAIAMGTGGTFNGETTASGIDSMALGNGTSATQQGAIALGAAAQATGTFSTALGAGAFATANGSTAVGNSATAGGRDSSAIGLYSTATANMAVALGARASATGVSSVALGADSTANRANAVAVGNADTQRQIMNMAAGTADTDATNVGQLKGIATALGGGAAVNSAGAIVAPSYAVAGGTHNNVGAALSALNTATVQFNGAGGAANVQSRKLVNLAAGTLSATSTDAVNGSQLNATNTNVTNIDGRVTTVEGSVTNIANQINNGTTGLVQQDATTKTITVAKDKDGELMDLTGTAGARQLTGVANGTVAANSLFAVNGGQLYGVSSSISSSLGGGSVVNADGTVSAPTYNVGGTTVNNVGAAITNLDGRVSNIESSVTNVTNQINNGEIGLVKQDTATGNINVATDKGGKVVNMAGTDGARKITGVADGAIAAGSSDAVNGGQIYALTQQVSNVSIASNYFQADGKKDGSDAAVVKAGSNGVATGSSAEASGNASVAIGAKAKASEDNSVALGANSVADRANTVSVGDAGTERQITNVAAGTQETDAVNVRQLQDYTSQGNSQTLSSANAYTDKQVGAARRDADAGTAAAMAMAGLPQATMPGKGMMAVGTSTYEGEAAIAVGVSKMSGSGKWVYKATVSSNTRGNYGATVGAGFHW
ncbi:YadA-like family protein [Cupriavidus campinensis]